MAAQDRQIQHLLRRSGFGARADDVDFYGRMGFNGAVDYLLSYESIPDAVDDQIGKAGYVGVTSRGPFSPNTNIADARQRWLFRMVHTRRPLQEKMALFWHNHFATAYTKIAGIYGAADATRMMAAKPSEDPGNMRGQIELFRQYALGNFRDLLVEIAKDAAMLVWLDGRTNTRARPQENFAREIMELFTMGVGHYNESDVYAGARVFTGWNLRRQGVASDPAGVVEFAYNASQHETSAKEFSFPVYPDGSRTIPARPADQGMQDGIDFIYGLARHPATALRLARRLYSYFVSELVAPDEKLVSQLAAVYLQNNFTLRPVVRTLLQSPQFSDSANYFARYSWPVEFVVRAVKEVGWAGLSVNDTLNPLINMGQQLFEPPDVSGWELGRAWFSTGSMLSRMNFSALLAGNQRFNIAAAAKGNGKTPEQLLSFYLDQLTPADYDRDAYEDLRSYLRAGGTWTGADAQLAIKAPGLVHLIIGSSEYQFV